MSAPKPVIRYRNGRWICRGAGHQGSSRSPVAAYCAWQAGKSQASLRESLRRHAAFMDAIKELG